MEKLVEFAEAQPQYMEFAALFVMSYCFLLRVPSEAIPAVARGEGQSSLRLVDGGMELRLRRRNANAALV